MQKLHNLVRHFSSKINNLKDYNGVLEQHSYVVKNNFKQDHNDNRILLA